MTFNWGGEGYCDYQGYCKVTHDMTQAKNQTIDEANFLQNMMKTQFGEQQDLLNKVLIPQLTQMATNPQGFGAKALADMQSQLINTVGGQYASQTKGLQEKFATSNMAGLPSGVQAALQANLAQGASGIEAGGLQNIDIQNAQLKNQQQQFGLSGLASADELLGQAPGSAKLALGANQQSFKNAQALQGQGSIWGQLLGGVIGAGLNYATGGLSGAIGNLDTKGTSSTGEQFGNFFTGLGGGSS
jgi:hypothetical protein